MIHAPEEEGDITNLGVRSDRGQCKRQKNLTRVHKIMMNYMEKLIGIEHSCPTLTFINAKHVHIIIMYYVSFTFKRKCR